MAEAEDVITDAASTPLRLQRLWRRKRPKAPSRSRLPSSRSAWTSWSPPSSAAASIRTAEPPAPPTLLRRLFERSPRARGASRDRRPSHLASAAPCPRAGLARFRTSRCSRPCARARQRNVAGLGPPLERAVYLVLEALAADAQLRACCRAARLAQRRTLPVDATALQKSRDSGRARSRALARRGGAVQRTSGPASCGATRSTRRYRRGGPSPTSGRHATRSSRARRGCASEADDDEDEPGAWMVQTAQPHEQAEDPMGLQRPTDRDESTAAEDFADALSELPEARLVSRRARRKKCCSRTSRLLRRKKRCVAPAARSVSYPEWDYRIGGYRSPGATVRAPAHLPRRRLGRRHAGAARSAGTIRRRFEMLRARRVRLRRQLDGDEIDLEAYIDSHADFRAGLPRGSVCTRRCGRPARHGDPAAHRCQRLHRRWICGSRRVIDVEREALLLVCIALEGWASPMRCWRSPAKGRRGHRAHRQGFDERHGTRSRGASPRSSPNTTRARAPPSATPRAAHARARAPPAAAAAVGRQAQRRRRLRRPLRRRGHAPGRDRSEAAGHLSVLPDHRPAAGDYLPGVFGATQYALLPRPELLPTVLLDWIRRLAGAP